MNPNETLNVLDSIRQKITDSQIACQNAIEFLAMIRVEIDKEVEKLNKDIEDNFKQVMNKPNTWWEREGF